MPTCWRGQLMAMPILPENRHGCQRCHNRYDAPHRQRTREARKRRQMEHVQGQLFEAGPMEAIL